jgi:hypothetical protein
VAFGVGEEPFLFEGLVGAARRVHDDDAAAAADPT